MEDIIFKRDEEGLCPICKAEHEMFLAPNKLVYECPSCGRKVRAMPPQTIKVPKIKSKSEAKRLKIQVESAQDIPKEVAEEVKKAVEEVLEEKPAPKKKTKRSKTSKKKVETKK